MIALPGSLRHFTGSLLVTTVGLALGAGVGLWYLGTVAERAARW